MEIKDYNDMEFAQNHFLEVKNKLLNKFSPAETHFEEMLKEKGIYYVRERSNFKISTRWCYYDFHLPLYRLYVEIDGPEHKIESHKKIDEEKFDIIASKQRFLVRLTNQEVLDMKSIDMDHILDKLIEQSKHKLWFTSELTLGEYLRNIKANLTQTYSDYIEETGKTLKPKEPIYVFNKQIGRAFVFENKLMAKIALQTHFAVIEDYLTRDYSKVNNRIKFVLAYSEEELRNRVKSGMGIENFPAPKESNCHLIKTSSKAAKRRLYFLPTCPKFFSHVFYNTARRLAKHKHQNVDEVVKFLIDNRGYKEVDVPHKFTGENSFLRSVLAYDKENYGDKDTVRQYVGFGTGKHRFIMRELPFEYLCYIYEYHVDNINQT